MGEGMFEYRSGESGSSNLIRLFLNPEGKRESLICIGIWVYCAVIRLCRDSRESFESEKRVSEGGKYFSNNLNTHVKRRYMKKRILIL